MPSKLESEWALAERLWQERVTAKRLESNAYGFDHYETNDDFLWENDYLPEFMEENADLILPRWERMQKNAERARVAALHETRAYAESIRATEDLAGDLGRFAEQARLADDPEAYAADEIVQIVARHDPDGFVEAERKGLVSEAQMSRAMTRQLQNSAKDPAQARIDNMSVKELEAAMTEGSRGSRYDPNRRD